MSISDNAVKKHLKSIFAKLGVSDRVNAVTEPSGRRVKEKGYEPLEKFTLKSDMRPDVPKPAAALL